MELRKLQFVQSCPGVSSFRSLFLFLSVAHLAPEAAGATFLERILQWNFYTFMIQGQWRIELEERNFSRLDLGSPEQEELRACSLKATLVFQSNWTLCSGFNFQARDAKEAGKNQCNRTIEITSVRQGTCPLWPG